MNNGMGARCRQAGMMVALLAALLGGCSSGTAVMDRGNAAAPQNTGFRTCTIQLNGETRKYGLFLPFDYTPDRPWPAIVFLHGVGEGGSDGTANLGVGLAPAIAERAASFPFIAIFPQSSNGQWGADSVAAEQAMAILDQVSRDYHVDPNRVILTGLSTGGYGTWAIGAKHADRFAALVPMCGYTDYPDVPKLTQVPVWCFHNGGDPFVFASGSAEMCKRINEAGGHALYTQYDALGHDVWVRAYAQDDLFRWMLQQRRTGSGNTAKIDSRGKEHSM